MTFGTVAAVTGIAQDVKTLAESKAVDTAGGVATQQAANATSDAQRAAALQQKALADQAAILAWEIAASKARQKYAEAASGGIHS